MRDVFGQRLVALRMLVIPRLAENPANKNDPGQKSGSAGRDRKIEATAV